MLQKSYRFPPTQPSREPLLDISHLKWKRTVRPTQSLSGRQFKFRLATRAVRQTQNA